MVFDLFSEINNCFQVMVGTESEKRHGQREEDEQHVQLHRQLLYNPSFLGEKRSEQEGL